MARGEEGHHSFMRSHSPIERGCDGRSSRGCDAIARKSWPLSLASMARQVQAPAPIALVKAPSPSPGLTNLAIAIASQPPLRLSAGFTIDLPMVPARMAAILAVALVLLCGSVPSTEGEVMGYVTQVKLESSNDSAMAPAITSVTGSNATHSAVLSDLPQGESQNFEQVDLARADDEDMTMHLTSAPAPSPTEVVPEGLDSVEGEAPALSPSTEEEAPEPVSPGEDSAELAALGPDTAPHGNDPSGDGKMVSGYPELPAGQDFSNGDQYGVINATTLGSNDASLSALSEDSADPSEDGKEGKVVSGYPELPAGQDFSNGGQYGVNNPTTLGSNDASFSALSEDSADPSEDGNEGKVVSGYPELPAGHDFSNGDQYGVNNPTTLGSNDASFSALSEDSADPSGDGKMVFGYPELPASIVP